MMACAKSGDSDLEEEADESERNEQSTGAENIEAQEASRASNSTACTGKLRSQCHDMDEKHVESDSALESGSKQAKNRTTRERRAKTLTLRRKKSDSGKDAKKSRDRFWTFRIKKRFPSRLRKGKDHGLPEPPKSIECNACICTGYRRTEDHVLGPGVVFSAEATIGHPPVVLCQGAAASGQTGMSLIASAASRLLQQVPAPPQPAAANFLDLSKFNPDEFPTEDIDEILIAQRARDIEQGIEISPTQPTPAPVTYHVPQNQPPATHSGENIWHLSTVFQNQCVVTTSYPEVNKTQESPPQLTKQPSAMYIPRTVHTQVDYIHCIVPDLLPITNCSFYWGVMDRYEAERLLENKPEGTFLLRDSAQEEFLFSVSFRRYGRSLHARIEQWNHRFSFDSHDPGVFASNTVCGLIEHYKDPSCCMFFEPMLTLPLHRTFPFSLQHLCRSVICNQTTYDGISVLPLPKSLRQYLKYYHYKQKVRVRKFDCHH